MTPQTRRGVFNNLAESSYHITMHGLTFYFSSRFNQERFMIRLIDNRRLQQERFYKRYHATLKTFALADLILYRQIENRGFRIIDENGGEATCPEQLEFMVRVQVAK